MTDITIKIYTTGKLSGYFAMFMNTDKAKKSYGKDLLAYKVSLLDKAEKSIVNRKLHYQVISL